MNSILPLGYFSVAIAPTFPTCCHLQGLSGEARSRFAAEQAAVFHGIPEPVYRSRGITE